ncbi:hypothetical protein [Streptosporangium sp. NPDC000396]|uniref:hypothetical protein n=1 Tax=Streptosporangium sp. NPDC000396 TaxID=3366185 RepID=UPI0036C3CF66
MSIQEELRQVESDLARLRAEAADLRTQVGEIGPTDVNERAALITMAEQQESLAGELEARRERLLEQIGDAKHAESQGS